MANFYLQCEKLTHTVSKKTNETSDSEVQHAMLSRSISKRKAPDPPKLASKLDETKNQTTESEAKSPTSEITFVLNDTNKEIVTNSVKVS